MSDPNPPTQLNDFRPRARKGTDYWVTEAGDWAVIPAEDLERLIDHSPADLGPSLGLPLSPLGRDPDYDDDGEENAPTVIAPSAAPAARQNAPVVTPRTRPTPKARHRGPAATPVQAGIIQGLVLAALMLGALSLGLYAGDQLGRERVTAVLKQQAQAASAEARPAPAVEVAPEAAAAATDAQVKPPEQPAAAPEQPTTAPPEAPTPATKPERKRTGTSKTRSVTSHIRAGWDSVESAPDEAALRFQQALATAPNNTDAVYGYGYAQLRLGNPESAKPYLCRARSSSSTETRREIDGLMRTHNLSCEP